MDINQNTLKGTKGLLIFDISNKEFCADIKNLITIIRVNEAEFSDKNEINDQFYYEGRLFKIIDINKILKTKMNGFTSNSRIILFETFGKMFGFIADKILEIITLDSIFQEKYLDLIPVTNERYVSGELLFQKRKIFLLDFERLSKDLNTFQKFNFGSNKSKDTKILFD